MSSSPATAKPAKTSPKLLEQVVIVARLKHLSRRTEKAYKYFYQTIHPLPRSQGDPKSNVMDHFVCFRGSL